MPPEHETVDGTPTRRSVLKKSSVVLGAISLGGLAMSGHAGAAESTTTHQTIDLTGLSRYNPCTEEVVTVTQGRSKFVTHTTEEDDGGLHTHMKVSIQNGRGVGEETGNTYQLQEAFSWSTNVKPPFPATETLVITQYAISHGKADDLRIRTRIRMTINANGVTVEDVEFTEIECTG